jgi:hypothetical protein
MIPRQCPPRTAGFLRDHQLACVCARVCVWLREGPLSHVSARVHTNQTMHPLKWRTCIFDDSWLQTNQGDTSIQHSYHLLHSPLQVTVPPFLAGTLVTFGYKLKAKLEEMPLGSKKSLQAASLYKYLSTHAQIQLACMPPAFAACSQGMYPAWLPQKTAKDGPSQMGVHKACEQRFLKVCSDL